MKYEVLHSHLMSPEKVFKRGDIVTPKDLEGAGFDVEFLLANTAIEPLKGTSDRPAGDVGPAKVEKVGKAKE